MAGSFAAGAKAEMCRNIPGKSCCVLAECFGVLLFCNSFSADGIRIITESREFAQLLPKLFYKAFRLEFDLLPAADSQGKQTFAVTDSEKIGQIMSTYGFDPQNTLCVGVNLPIVEEECCKAAFLRGAFLAGGSVTDPGKGYHLEFATTHHGVARQTYALMEDVMGFYPKSASRGGGQVLYLKQSDRISDCLVHLGAPAASMAIIEAKLEKGLNNMVNRCCNCDNANMSKVVQAAQEQLTAIRILQERGQLEKLPEILQSAAKARFENPEDTLTELAAMMNPPITKSAMNNRLQKLVALSKEQEVVL